jgi:tetratricopeptide (TPR) repeat protein
LLKKHKHALPLLALVIIAGFSFTRMVVQWYQQRQELLASRWYARGVAALQSGQAERSVQDFETVLAYAKRENYEYRFTLAQALVTAGRLPEAHSRLLNLLDERPSDARVNLALARLAVRSGDLSDAVQYYHGAIDGIWSQRRTPSPVDDAVPPERMGNRHSPEVPFAPAGVDERMNTRLELAEALAANHNRDEAEAELTAMAAELPPNAAAHARLGQAWLKIDDPRSALDEFQQARQLDRSFAPAEAGLGAAQFHLGDFTAARRHLLEALRLNQKNREARQLLAATERVLDADPFSPGVNATERARRTVAAYQAAVARLDACAPSHADNGSPPGNGAARDVNQHSLAPLRSWAAELKPYAEVRRLRGRDDYIENMLRFVFATEDAAARACGPPGGLDAALAVIGQHRWKTEQTQ